MDYVPGTIKPNHLSQARLDDDVRSLYDAWKSRYLVQAGYEPDGHPRYRVRMGRAARDSTVSEGQGYGMVLAAYMAGYDEKARLLLDGLWEFALDHPSLNDSRLMDWWVNADESPDPYGDDSAFDGDADMAFALLLAEAQWGKGGRFDYGAEAARVMEGIMQSTIGPNSSLPLLGDWVDPNGGAYNEWTPRTSDFMLDHFRAFEAATGDPAWNDVVAACKSAVTLIQAGYSPQTGLLPDFLVPDQGGGALKPAPPYFLEGPWDGMYSYNACRDPWRLGIDALTSGDPQVLDQVRAIARWIDAATGGSPMAVRAGYTLKGSVLPGAGYFTTAFAAPFAVAAMTDPKLQVFLNGLYDAVRDSDEDYYEDSISLLCLIVITGNRWTP